MSDFRSIYKGSEHYSKLVGFGLFFLLVFLIFLQVFFSPFAVLAGVITVLCVVMTINRPLWTVLLLAAYLPFESFILKFIPQDIYVFARYFSEGLIYVLALVVLWKVLTRQIPFRRTPIDLAFVLFLVVLFASVVINVVSPTIVILGIRQILRFVFLFFIIVYLHPPKKFMQQLTRVMLVIV